MNLLGTIVNSIAILIGGGAGLLVNKGLPKRFSEAVMVALALCASAIGITGIAESSNTLILILSMVLGALVGEAMQLHTRVHKIGHRFEKKASEDGDHNRTMEGFVTATLLFCVGAMAIIGALQSGLTGDHTMQFVKAVMDGISAFILASSLGGGVLLSSVVVFIYQGSITVLAGLIAPLLTDAVIAEMTAAGSLLMVALALNLLQVTNIKIMNLAPAVFFPILLGLFL